MTRHPSKYSDLLLPIMKRMLSGYTHVLDPFAGVGKIREIRPDAVLNELEPEWLYMGGAPATLADATLLPFADNSFDAVCTSPVYGNRMSDCFTDGKPEKKYVRNTYTHAIGRKLHPRNTGKMQWGKKYRDMHVMAWKECYRVLSDSSTLVLSISDHIRRGVRTSVSAWHASTLVDVGFRLVEVYPVVTRRNKFGQNRDARVGHEYLMQFIKGKDKRNAPKDNKR